MASVNAIFMPLRKLNQSHGEKLYSHLGKNETHLSMRSLKECLYQQGTTRKIRLVQDKILICTTAALLGQCSISFQLYIEQLGGF